MRTDIEAPTNRHKLTYIDQCNSTNEKIAKTEILQKKLELEVFCYIVVLDFSVFKYLKRYEIKLKSALTQRYEIIIQ